MKCAEDQVATARCTAWYRPIKNQKSIKWVNQQDSSNSRDHYRFCDHQLNAFTTGTSFMDICQSRRCGSRAHAAWTVLSLSVTQGVQSMAPLPVVRCTT